MPNVLSLASPGFRGKRKVNVDKTFYSISSLGTNTADSVPLPPLPVPSHPQENAIPSREPSLDVGTDLKESELSPAQPSPAECCGPDTSPVE